MIHLLLGAALAYPSFPSAPRQWAGGDPTVVVCPSSPVTIGQVRKGLALWASHGAPYLEVRHGRCSGDGTDGEVWVRSWRKAPPGDCYLGCYGLIYLIETEDDRAHRAQIVIRVPEDVVVAHEIGHIWFEHYAKDEQHIMGHPADNVSITSWSFVESSFQSR